VEAGGRSFEAVTAIVQNSDPFTYFAKRPIRVNQNAGLETGDLSVAALRRATVLGMPTLIARVFSGRPEVVTRHRQIESIPGVTRARVATVDGRPFPLQVDGDFIGEFEEVVYGIAPRSLAAVS
jgi:diacylglycerol kinase family enzyme